MTLNGWMRLWLSIAAVWFALLAWQVASNLPTGTADVTPTSVAVVILVGASPVLILSLVGLAVAWVRRGFVPPCSK